MNEELTKAPSDEQVNDRTESIGSNYGISGRGEVNIAVEPMGEEIGMDIATPSSDIRGISINPLSSGYMVKVGCQSVAVETTERLIDMLNKYLSDPAEFERKWYSKNVRNRLENI